VESTSDLSTRTVGRRRPATGLNAANNLLRLVVRLRGDKPFVPRGVHRFRSFEEAQQWSMKMMVRRGV
jgi:hypothetical protein